MKTKIEWQSASTPPDADMNVLIHLADGEVWTGFLDGDTWRFVTGDRIEVAVLHWADFPEPPIERPNKQIELPSDNSKWATYMQPKPTK